MSPFCTLIPIITVRALGANYSRWVWKPSALVRGRGQKLHHHVSGLYHPHTESLLEHYPPNPRNNEVDTIDWTRWPAWLEMGLLDGVTLRPYRWLDYRADGDATARLARDHGVEAMWANHNGMISHMDTWRDFIRGDFAHVRANADLYDGFMLYESHELYLLHDDGRIETNDEVINMARDLMAWWNRG